MAVCPGGTRPKESTPGLIILGGALLETLIARANPALAAVTSLLAPVSVDTRVLCNGDPPPVPELVALDFINLAMGQVTQNVKDLILRFAWYQFCECVDAPTPVPLPVPTPKDAPVYIPGPVLPCNAFHLQFATDGFQDPATDVYGTAAAPIGLVAGATSVTVTTELVERNNNPYDAGYYAFFLRWLNASGVNVQTNTAPISYSGASVFPTSNTWAVPAGATQFYILAGCHPGGGPPCTVGDIIAADWKWYCTPDPKRTQPECCPPDPALAARLDFLVQQIELILSRLGPLGPMEALATIPITGEGTVDLEPGARQVNIQLSTFGEGTKLVPYAYPDRLMRAGTVRFGNPFGWRRREHVDNTDCLFLIPADSTIVSWSLSPGTTGLLVQLGAPV